MEKQRKPLYQQIAESLHLRICVLPEGSRLASEQELARQFSTSIITIREALKRLASEGLIERQQGRGTFVASRNKLPNKHIALLIDQDTSHPYGSPIYFQIAQYLRRFLAEEGEETRLYVGTNLPYEAKKSINCPEFLAALKNRELSGIVAILAYPEESWVNEVESQKLPIVRNGRSGNDYGVNLDFRGMVFSAVEEMISTGRTDLALFTNTSLTGFPNRSVQAFKEVLRAKGLLIRDEWIKSDFYTGLPGLCWESLREIWTMGTKHPNGLLISDNMLLSSLSAAVTELGIKVPEDLKIITHLNKGAHVSFPFPVVSYIFDPEEIAATLAAMIIKLLRKERSPVEIILPAKRMEISPFTTAIH